MDDGGRNPYDSGNGETACHLLEIVVGRLVILREGKVCVAHSIAFLLLVVRY